MKEKRGRPALILFGALGEITGTHVVVVACYLTSASF